ncbi:hypothetical protein Thiowin_02578 [Thiorhodovibrio winogradskyi]|uniref:SAM-dependent methyltransferase n=1 Tax=Thiorhodovibrio winogradskyi TaxID=77007 RepID=A0ABZ0SA81_9GAMM|nr:SAM-dependent methyltransferase [Thiorhodovibrio winogradskyi]
MQLDDIVPWGRSFDEYVAMFDLTADDLGKRILGCGDGPAAFNAHARARGARVISVDPIYAWPAGRIHERIRAVRPIIESELRREPERCLWERFRDVDDLIETRLGAMDRFLADYAGGHGGQAYVAAQLPQLPFPGGVFDLALVSHLLFTYSKHLSADAHRKAVAELMRVSGEVRLFPLLTLAGTESEHLPAVIDLC